MYLPGRHERIDPDGYRYGYQGSEKDNEVKGENNSYTTFYRNLDPRLGRWLSRDPKVTAFESPYGSMKNNPILFNDIKGDTIKNRHIADYQGKTPEYHHSSSPLERKVGDYYLTPYLNKDGGLVGYAAWREDTIETIGVEYYLGKGDYNSFKDNILHYTHASNLFYINGVPEQGVIAMASGDTWKGLKMQWSAALKDPNWYFSVATAFSYSGILVNEASQLRAIRNNTSVGGRVSFNKGKNGKYSSGQGKQGRHLQYHPDHTAGKSYFKSIEDAQEVLKAYHSGRTTVLEVINDNTVIVRYNGVEGYHLNAPMIRAGRPAEITNVFEITGTGSVKIVPKNPLNY